MMCHYLNVHFQGQRVKSYIFVRTSPRRLSSADRNVMKGRHFANPMTVLLLLLYVPYCFSRVVYILNQQHTLYLRK